MKRPPFKMLPSRGAALRRDGKHVVSGRASFVWETYLLNRASGVPGEYEIRRGENGSPWHRLDWSIEDGEEALLLWGFLKAHRTQRVMRCQKRRRARAERGLPVG